MNVLMTADYYLPGSLAGGPIRSLANLVELLGDEFSFRILTRNRDLGVPEAYPDVPVGRWVEVGKAQVLYLGPGLLTLANLRALLRDTPHDVLYFNSFFSPFTIKTLLLRKLGLVKSAGAVLSPKGELCPGALAIKRFKKLFFCHCARAVGLYRGLIWQASSPYEAADISRRLAAALPPSDVHIVPDLAVPPPQSLSAPPEKAAGSLRIVFLSRISPKKNLDFALSLLAGLPGEIHFTIYGPIEDAAYWTVCQERIAALPANVRATYGGIVAPGEVAAVLRKHHLFFLPTHSENFGHAIVEALGAGCPALLSDQTPWVDLEAAGAGWALPLEKPECFQQVLRSCVQMDAAAHRLLCERAARYAEEVVREQQSLDGYRQMFHAAASRTHAA